MGISWGNTVEGSPFGHNSNPLDMQSCSIDMAHKTKKKKNSPATTLFFFFFFFTVK